MMRSEYNWLKSHVLRCWRNDVNEWADVVYSGRTFQMREAATGKAWRLPTVSTVPHLCLQTLLLSVQLHLSHPCWRFPPPSHHVL